MKTTLWIISSAVVLMFNGCASNGYTDFYKPYYDQETLNKGKELSRLVFLKDGENPKILGSNDFKKDILLLKSKKYIPIGYSSFNGSLENESSVIAQAKNIGAVLAIYNWKYTDTQQNSGVMMLPTTNYSTTNMYGYAGGNMYSGTAYTQSSSTQMVPYSNTQRRYDQNAVFFVKATFDAPFGTWESTPITREERIDIGANGIKVNCIIENTPVYNSDLMVGDIITNINNHEVNNLEEYSKLAEECVKTKDICILKVIRNKEIKEIKVKF